MMTLRPNKVGMTFLSSHSAAWMILVFALLGAVTLLIAEWRRPDTRRRPARLGATLLAIAALALWALRPARRGGEAEATAGQATAALWTVGTMQQSPAPTEVEPRYRFALPGADTHTDAGATFLPDAATLRRRFPEIGRLHILGDGLDPAELSSLAGLRVEFTPGSRPTAAANAPSILSLRCPRGLTLGDTLVVEGRAGGLRAGETTVFTLEAPDGTTTEGNTSAADTTGEAGFTVRAPSPSAAGKFEWPLHLKGSATHETLGIEVRAPSLPRVLVLESAPRFDTALLRRWYEDAGGTVCERLRLGQDRYRFFAANRSVPMEFNALDTPLLARFDLVLADGRALASLPAPEREILRAAVADTGLGLLVLADDALLPPAVVAPDRAWLFPWQLRALEAATDNTANGTEHLARAVWPGLAQPAEIPLPAAPVEIVPRSGQTGVVRDDQGRTLAALATFGRGTLALTLVRETGRWQRANEPGAFAGYWSFLFAQTARRQETSGRWTLAGGDDGPMFVDQPLELVWNGPPPAAIHVTDESDAAPVTLAPESDPNEPNRWRATFWPRRAGWQRVESGSARLDFYVHPAGSWPALAAERKREGTARFAAQTSAGPVAPTASHPSEPTPVAAGWWFGAFLLGAGFLWIERRMARA